MPAQSVDQRKQLDRQLLKTLVAEVLEVSRDEIDLQSAPTALGLDSLAAADLRERIDNHCGITIPIEQILSAKSLSAVMELEPDRAIGRESVQTLPSLSATQQALCFLHTLEPDSSMHHISVCFKWHAQCSAERIKAAVAKLLDRHPELTATFERDAGGQFAKRYHTRDVNCYIHHHPLDERDLTAVKADLQALVNAPINLAKGPLFRLECITRPGQEIILLFIAHHVIMDLWSFAVLLDDFVAHLVDIESTHARALPYTEFVAQQENLPEHRRNVVLKYWRERLLDPPARLRFDGHAELGTGNNGGQRYGFNLPAQLTADLHKRARSAGVSMNSLLLALYMLSLSRYSQQSDILVGLPVAGRRASGFVRTVGCFINSVLIRANTNVSFGLEDFARLVHTQVLSACRHQELPFQEQAKILAGNTAGTPLKDLQSMFVLQRAHKLPGAAALVLGVEEQACFIHDQPISPLTVLPSAVPFDVSLMMVDIAGELHGRFEFRPQIITARTVVAMAEYFCYLAERLVLRPSIAVDEIASLTDIQHQQWLKLCHGRQVDYSGPPGIFTRFLNTATQRPEHPAVEMGNDVYSYQLLLSRANALAAILVDAGVQVEQRMVVVAERSPETVVAMLAAWQVGAVYVPIDANLPGARVKQIIDDCQPVCVLASSRTAALIPEAWRSAVLCMDQLDIDQQVSAPQTASLVGKNLAYIIYTSGSEGVPKGVMITHQGAINFALAQAEELGIDDSFRLLQLASFGFDASMSDVLMTLLTGATLIIAAEPERIPGVEFSRLVNTSRIQVITTAASLLEATPAPDFKHLKIVISTAEACTDSIVRKWGQRYALYNGYGPTETTVGATLGRCNSSGSKQPLHNPSIGNPFNNYSVYALDPSLKPAPFGVRGEIFIGGAGVARGYVDNPAKTAAAFIPDPFAVEPGSRMYRTGDQARLLFNGEFEFIGRQDQQINIRGHRVELAEVERMVRACKGVSNAAVIETSSARDEPQLTAFVQLESGETLTVEDLKQQFAIQLPGYMLPGNVVITKLGLLVNGKIDRQALLNVLPQTRFESAVSKHDRDAELKQRLTTIWAQVLGHSSFSGQDNFFDVGGHSLALVEVQAAIETELSAQLSVQELLQYHTVEKLAERLSLARPSRAKTELVTDTIAKDEPIAIVGIACRLPGADTPEQFWQNLCAVKCSVQHFSAEQLKQAGIAPELIGNSEFVAARAPLEQPYDFDAALFGCPAREAELLDPQRRLLLECAYAALQEAGYGQKCQRQAELIGAYLSASGNSYYSNFIQSDQALRKLHGDTRLSLASDKSFVATYVAYKLALGGPAVTVDTACSSSLVAVHEACKSIRSGDCSIAIAGGMSIDSPVVGGHRYEPSGIGSKDGYCRAFDAAATGTVKGMGGGVVVLKSLSQAQRDGDFIHAVIHGSAINNDAGRSAGFTAPSVDGQVDVIRRALTSAGVKQQQIAFIEAHGTGTPLGDPIEMTALKEVFDQPQPNKIMVGAVKSNIGHLDAAAGIAGLIKATLALRFGSYPPIANLQQPNPKLKLDGSALELAVANQSLPDMGETVYAGVSSFGMGGTNCHVVLGQSAQQKSSKAPARPQLVTLAAHSQAALQHACTELAGHLEAQPDSRLTELAYSLNTGQEHWPWRVAFVTKQHDQLIAQLKNTPAVTTAAPAPQRQIWVFPGQAGQRPGLARELYAHEAVFRETLQAGIDLLSDAVRVVCRDWLLQAWQPGQAKQPTVLGTEYLQPALFCYEFALCRYLQSFGFEPAGMLGHSLGELVAATLAGSITFEDAVSLVEARGHWMSRSSPGAMLVVGMGQQQLQSQLTEELEIAVINSDRECVISGAKTAIGAFKASMAVAGIRTAQVTTRHAFHCSALDEILPDFREQLAALPLKPPKVPWVSNVTGKWITDEQATSTEYWVNQMRQPVQLNSGFASLLEWQDAVLVIVGSGAGLQRTIRDNAAYQQQHVISIGSHALQQTDDLVAALEGVKALWQQGLTVDFQRYFAANQNRIQRAIVPGYSFDRQHYCVSTSERTIEAKPAGESPQQPITMHSAGDLSPVRSWLQNTWHELLGIQHIQPDMDFFAAGADSLTVMRLCGLLKERWQLQLSPQQLASAAVFDNMASLIEATVDLDQQAVPVFPVNAQTTTVSGAADDWLPLSYQQRRMWFQHYLEAEPSILNLPLSLSISGDIGIDTLIQAVRTLIHKHPSLRTRFIQQDGELFQAFDREPDAFSLEVYDLAQSDVGEQLTKLANAPFELKQDWLIRAGLIRTSSEQAWLVVVCHHIICDGHSLALLMHELLAACGGQSIPVSDQHNIDQLCAYVLGQAEQVKSGALDTQLDYWRSQLVDVSDTPLPGELADQAELDTIGQTLIIPFADEFSGQLQQFCQDYRLTPYVVMLAVFKCLLGRYTGGMDVCVGAPITERQNPELIELVGLFVNTVVLRTRLTITDSFLDVCQQLRDTVYQALENGQVPFDIVAEELAPQRGDPAQTPFFRVAFVMESAQQDKLQVGDWAVAIEPVNKLHAQFELALWLNHSSERMSARLEYRKAVFDSAVLSRFATELVGFADQLLGDPQAPVFNPDQQSIKFDDDRSILLEPGLDGAAALPVLLQRAALQHADQCAVYAGEHALSYAEFEQRAVLLAGQLIHHGVARGDRVGIYMQRSLALPVAIYAILKCGAVMVPLETELPQARLQHMLTDSGVKVVLSQSDVSSDWLNDDIQVLSVDGIDWDANQPTAVIPADVSSDDLAYIIYTSGSTGVPKGVVNSHRGLVNRLLWMNRNYEFGSSDCFLHKTPISFDVSLWELFCPLLCGASVVMAAPEQHRDPRAISKLLGRFSVTVVHFVPSMLKAYLGSSVATDTASLKYVFCSGEGLPRDSMERATEHFGSDVRIVNLYGPTEASIEVSVWEYAEHCPGPVAPLGKPINGVAMYVLDHELQLVARGETGELYLGGDCVALGYQRLAAMTAQGFMPDPFIARDGARMYKTGDIARLLEDGNIEFLGRDDDQLKIHGFRIETGEIEATLLAANEVIDAAVICSTTQDSEPRLVAYVVFDSAAVSDTSAGCQSLRHWLAERLPGYMLPAAIIPLEWLPVGANGKLDRAALPSAKALEVGTGEDSRAASEFEQKLIAIWQQVLGVTAVNIGSNFFELGGSSIAAIKLADRIEAGIGRECTIRLVFRQPILSDLATALEVAPLIQTPVTLPVCQADIENAAEPFVLTDLQNAYWAGRARAFEMGNIATHGYLELDVKELRADIFRRAVSYLINRHDALRLIVDDQGRQRVLSTVPELSIENQDLSAAPAPQQQAAIDLIRSELEHAAYDPSEWPLFEFRMVKLESSLTRLFISIDALLVDGWSIQLLERDLNLCYQQLLDDQTMEQSTGAEEQLHLRDYVETLEALTESEVYARARSYWEAKLIHLPAAPPLPLAIDPGGIEVPEFKRVACRLDQRCTDRLQKLAVQHSASLSAVLLTAYAELLASWCNTTAFSLNLTISDRVPVHPGVDDLVGNLSSLLILGIELQPGASFSQHLAGIQQTLLDDMQHRYYSGLQVMRQLAAMHQGSAAAQMPVVFTSMLGARPDTKGSTSQYFDFSQPAYAVTQTSQAWLDCNVGWSEGGLMIAWDAVASLFPAGMLEYFHHAYIDLLTQLADVPACWSGAASPLFSDRQQLLWLAASSPSASLGRGRLLQDLFLDSAQRFPERIAISSPQRDINYRQLKQLAIALAVQLQKLGARPNLPVALLMTNGWEQVVASLGVLLAGAPYLPINANSPSHRWEQLLTLGECEIVITQTHIADDEIDNGKRHLIRITESSLNADTQTCRADVSSRDLAYVMFTSGSTGTPKGVMIDHRGAVNTVLDINARFAVAETDAVLAISEFTFDLSVYDVFGLLAAGGKIVFPEQTLAREPQHWLSLIREQEVTIWNAVPALTEMLVDYCEAIEADSLTELRLLLVSGDWVPVSLPRRTRSVCPTSRFISLGGATEASIWSIAYPVTDFDETQTSIPYGKALTAQSVLVLDDAMRVCPAGVNGHIFIGGVGVAAGYWRSPTLTAASFTEHPVTAERLYRTGDLGRYLDSGDIEFLGRSDNQVKIRGHRIELGEIEHQLTQLPQIDAAAVSLHQTSERQAALFAYLTADGQAGHYHGDDNVFKTLSCEQAYDWVALSEAVTVEASRPRIELQVSGAELKQQIPALNQQYQQAVIGLFRQLNLLQQPGDVVTAEEVLGKGAIATRYRQWVIRALNYLADRDYLEQDEQRWRCRQVLPATGNDQPLAFDLLGILSERESSAELYLSDETVAGYQTIFAQCHSMVSAAIETLLAQRAAAGNANAGLNILEVGAGHGSCTQHVLPLLPADTNYVFSDISPFFLHAAKQNFEAFEFVKYTLFNLDEHPLLQGHAPHGYDLVIAASVLHDIRQIGSGLSALHSLLKPGGVLLMIEETRFFPFFDLGMGLQQGFDVFQDKHLRSLHPLLSRQQWVEQLQINGFEAVEWFNHQWSASEIIGFDVIMARMPDSIEIFDEVLADQYLRTRLPDYMIPARFIQLYKMPLTANGKLDRKALPSPPEMSRQDRLDYAPPETEQEQQLAAVWEEVLGISMVGVTDNFFELGGDSLLAVQLATKIQTVFAVEYPVRAVFEAPTVRETGILLELLAGVSEQPPDEGLANTDGTLRGQL